VSVVWWLRRSARNWPTAVTIVGSIGPTCSAALEQFDVTPHVVASPPKMRPLVTAVGQFLAERRSHHTTDTDS